jgi:hypothetical protein
MNAIVMGIKNIRLMTKATSDALAKLGIDGEEMTRKLNDGSMTIFEAMRQVSQAIEKTGSGSQAAGEVMQAVFGRQGVAAGTNLGKAIATLNTNLEETKRQTGELGEAYADLQNANERLNKAIRDCFGYDGWEQMTTGIKTQLITALSATLEKCNTLYKALDRLGMVDAFSRISTAVLHLINPFQQLVTLANTLFNTLGQDIKTPVIKGVGYSDMEKSMGYIKRGGSKSVREQRYNAIHADLVEKFNNAPGGAKQTALLRRITMLEQQKASLINPQTTVTTAGNGSNKGGTGKGGSTTTELTEQQKLQQQINDLVQQGLKMDDEGRAAQRVKIAALQDQLQTYNEIENELRGIEKKEKAPEMAEGVSGLNQKAISTYQSMLQESMKGMEYGSTDLTQTLANSIDVTTLSNLLKTTLDQGLDITKMKFENGSPVIESLWEKILSGENIPDKVWEDLGAIFSEQLKAKGGKGIKINTGTGAVSEEEEMKSEDYLQQMQKLTSGLSSINSGFQTMGIKLPTEIQKLISILQGVSTVVQGVQTIISVFSTGSQTANTAALTLNTGVMTALTAAVVANTAAVSANSVTNFFPFATGGIVHAAGGVMVPGNSFSGDRVPALLNSGEIVLNKSQQYNLASQLEGDGNQGTTPSRPYVSGEQIYLGLNNYLRRSGRGEIITSR